MEINERCDRCVWCGGVVCHHFNNIQLCPLTLRFYFYDEMAGEGGEGGEVISVNQVLS